MARRRSPAITSRVMVLYRSSKICSGSEVFGKSTTFGNGKIGTIIVQRGYYSVSHPRSTPAEGRKQKAEGRRQKAERISRICTETIRNPQLSSWSVFV